MTSDPGSILKKRHKEAVNALLKAAGDEQRLVGAEKLIVKAEYRKPWSGISMSLLIALIAVFLATYSTKAALDSIPGSRPPDLRSMIDFLEFQPLWSMVLPWSD